MWITVKGSKWTYSVYNVSNFSPIVFLCLCFYFCFGCFVGGGVVGFFLLMITFFFLRILMENILHFLLQATENHTVMFTVKIVCW